MVPAKQVTVAQMNAGQTGKVVHIGEGRGMKRRLEAMGLRAGKKITKVNSMLNRGPATVRVGRTQLAIGHGMATKVLVEVDND